MEKFKSTPEEVELFQRLLADHSKNYNQETVWTAPELENDARLKRRFWEWARLVKSGPEEEWSMEQDELEYAQRQEAKKKAAEQAAAAENAEGAR
ncbi:hypothetical protein [Verrucomicrobium spinosum]|uniref:hypothetical protein n=1 Tax=Verrucomicrobium spinosum TaxID=2736 RepID=UPI000301CD37|nr:hypothetical protein [Verrucomicrobium spinosum]